MNSNDKSLKEVIDELLKAYALDGKLDQIKLINSWPQIVGPVISKHTTHIYIHNRTLFVELDSSVVRNELTMSREVLLALLNKGTEKRIIDDIVFK